MRGSGYVVGVILGNVGLGACGRVEHSPMPSDAPLVSDIDGFVQPAPLCVSPPSTPSATFRVDIFGTPNGYTGTDTKCALVGSSNMGTNPQFISCRRWGTKVGDNTQFNHYWLWTALDSPPSHPYAWISAYYIKDQGNDVANDSYTRQPIATCP